MKMFKSSVTRWRVTRHERVYDTLRMYHGIWYTKDIPKCESTSDFIKHVIFFLNYVSSNTEVSASEYPENIYSWFI